ncbi:hypothetical protein Pcinc_023898 [Petrolisthes cinctipes]|uniref:Uncharacterized protein n=1 Tax=Petrolisthes cinctipes TaxID=88211 RepID=A0AAE1KCU8_PETCI|nr:hypothetical protein Pcinc_025573 [Petrolisthes cinctipes]KAK3870927.1 hypothetical protein Pcinc_023898 [Petrolisthes cinctipes]
MGFRAFERGPVEHHLLVERGIEYPTRSNKTQPEKRGSIHTHQLLPWCTESDSVCVFVMTVNDCLRVYMQEINASLQNRKVLL